MPTRGGKYGSAAERSLGPLDRPTPMDARPRQHGFGLRRDLLQPQRLDLQPCSESEAQLQRRNLAKSWLNLEALVRSSGADEPGKSHGVPVLGPARLLRVQLRDGREVGMVC